VAILAECPVCRKVQSKKNETCSCGANLKKLKKQKEKVKYYIVYRVNGKVKWELPDDPYSLDSAEACLGKRRVQKKEKHILDIEPEWNITFSQLTNWHTDRLENAHEARRLRSLPTLKLYLNKFNQKFGNMLVGNVTLADLEDLQLERQAQGNSPKTIQNEIGYVKSMINTAYKHKKVGIKVKEVFLCLESVYTKPEKEKSHRTSVYSVENFNKLLEHSEGHTRDVLILAYWTGMRAGEIHKLTWDKVDLKNRMIRLTADDTKEKKGKEIPIGDKVFEMLTAKRKVVRIGEPIGQGEPVFPNGRGENGEITRHFTTGLKTAHEKAGIPWGRKVEGGFIFHDLRRTFITDMDEAGVPKKVTDSITGHSDGTMHDHYSGIRNERKLEAVKELDLYRASVRQTLGKKTLSD
jgi:integrase